MDAEEKIEYVRKYLNDFKQTSPSGSISFLLCSVTHENNEDWTLLTLGEQKRILRRLEENGEIKNLKLDEGRRVSLEIVKIYQKNYLKTSTDYLIDVLNFFKDEYNKLKIKGITYEYCIGENIERYNGDPTDEEIEDYNYKKNALEQLNNVNLITKYEIESRLYGCSEIDFAICKIDENKLTKKEAPRATEKNVQELTKKVIHEHIQKIEITAMPEIKIKRDRNNTLEKNSKESLYITKKNDDFYYNGHYLKLSKKAEYYKVFCSLFSKLPSGGEITYKELTKEIQSRIPKTKSKNEEEMRKFIQSNLTDKSNGFVRYAEIPNSEDNGKPLIEIIRASGVVFNNKRG